MSPHLHTVNFYFVDGVRTVTPLLHTVTFYFTDESEPSLVSMRVLYSVADIFVNNCDRIFT